MLAKVSVIPTNDQEFTAEDIAMVSNLRCDIDMNQQVKAIRCYRQQQLLQRYGVDGQLTEVPQSHRRVFLKMLVAEAAHYHLASHRRRLGLVHLTRQEMLSVINAFYLRDVLADIDVLMTVDDPAAVNGTPTSDSTGVAWSATDKYSFVLRLLAKQTLFATFSRVKR